MPLNDTTSAPERGMTSPYPDIIRFAIGAEEFIHCVASPPVIGGRRGTGPVDTFPGPHPISFSPRAHGGQYTSSSVLHDSCPG